MGSVFVPDPSRVREVEDRVRTLLRGMGIREGATMRQLVERYCEHFGVRVVFQERVLPVDCFFAVTLKLSVAPDTYVIAYQAATAEWHKDHGIGHEFGHIIAGHYEVGDVAHHSEMSPGMEWEAEFTAHLLSRWSYEVGRALDRRNSLRPTQRSMDLSLPLQESVGWL